MSLPAPLSPTIRTLARVAATFSIFESSAWMRGDEPTSRRPSLDVFDMNDGSRVEQRAFVLSTRSPRSV
nr:hypothetical protein [Burkholderia gladioli]